MPTSRHAQKKACSAFVLNALGSKLHVSDPLRCNVAVLYYTSVSIERRCVLRNNSPMLKLSHPPPGSPPSKLVQRLFDASICASAEAARAAAGVTIARHVRRRGRRPQASKRLAPENKLFNSAPGQSHSLTISAFPRPAVWDIDGID